MTSARTMAL